MENRKISDTNFGTTASGGSRAFSSPARSVVLRLLQRLQHGSLLLVEAGHEHHFGEARQHAQVQATIVVNHPGVWQSVLGSGTLGAGEACMQGYWESPDLVQVIRLFVLNMELISMMDNEASLFKRLAARLLQLLQRNSLQGARRNIAAHYDLSNAFFRLFLDSTMAYSSAIFSSEAETLEAASLNKFRHVCERLQLQSSDHLLEIGTGWGGLALYAASQYGCRVTTTTLSREQAAYARAAIKAAGLEQQITVLEQDYRELQGQYDKLVSIEMIEAVGAQYYADYFRRCSALLKPQGLLLIQAITISDQRYIQSLRNMDFIKRYIFPGGQLPSNAVITHHLAQDTDMQLIGMQDLTRDYARTLQSWRHRFQGALPQVRALGFDETFIRMWHFYLCFCEGSFMERVIHTGQFLAAKPSFRALPPLL